jgi:hypothetical protein
MTGQVMTITKTTVTQSDAKRAVTQSDEDEVLSRKKKRHRVVVWYTVVNCWVTGDTAEQESTRGGFSSRTYQG